MDLIRNPLFLNDVYNHEEKYPYLIKYMTHLNMATSIYQGFQNKL